MLDMMMAGVIFLDSTALLAALSMPRRTDDEPTSMSRSPTMADFEAPAAGAARARDDARRT